MSISVMSVCPYVFIWQLKNNGTDSNEVYCRILLNAVQTSQFWLNSDTNDENFAGRPTCASV